MLLPGRKKQHPRRVCLHDFLVIGTHEGRPIQMDITAESAKAAEKEARAIYPGLLIAKITVAKFG